MLQTKNKISYSNSVTMTFSSGSFSSLKKWIVTNPLSPEHEVLVTTNATVQQDKSSVALLN